MCGLLLGRIRWPILLTNCVFFFSTEEWVTKKKVELTTKKQIETRVKRQVVLEDGKVVEDSGPIVTTNTTEDTEKQEHEQTEVIFDIAYFGLRKNTMTVKKILGWHNV